MFVFHLQAGQQCEMVIYLQWTGGFRLRARHAGPDKSPGPQVKGYNPDMKSSKEGEFSLISTQITLSEQTNLYHTKKEDVRKWLLICWQMWKDFISVSLQVISMFLPLVLIVFIQLEWKKLFYQEGHQQMLWLKKNLSQSKMQTTTTKCVRVSRVYTEGEVKPGRYIL